MFLLKPPSEEFIRRTIASQRCEELTYANVGWTEHSKFPPGFTTNHFRAVIANGEQGFQRARDALRNLCMLQLGWLKQVGPLEAILKDALVVTLAWQMPLYSLNVARIVYVDDSHPNKFEFGYGTLPEYPISGEERFTVDLDESTGDVSYEIFSFSRPNTLFATLGWPVVRRAQRRFGIDSAESMRVACRVED